MVTPARSDSKTERKGRLGGVSGMVISGRPPLRRGVLSWDLQLVALLSGKPLEEVVAGGGGCKDAAGGRLARVSV